MNYNKLTKAELVKALTSLQAISEGAQSVDVQQRLLHDLQLYQIELEMQNRELRETQQKLEASRNRYADLYDFAPLGYITLDKQGNILEINLTGASMLGAERSRLLGMPFFTYVAENEAKKFRAHLRQCPHTEKITIELRLTAGGKSIEVQLSSFAVHDPEWLTTVYRTAMIDITERKRADEVLQKRSERNIRYQTALLKLARMDSSDWRAAQIRITEDAAKALEVERVSIWLFNEDHSEIVCEDLYNSRRNAHEKGLRLQAGKYPRYFQALKENRTIAANDAAGDPRTSEFTEGYLKPFGITSMLDVPVWLHGRVVGIVCHEHTGLIREWKPEEQEFAASIADLVSLALETAERQRAEQALRESEERFRVLANGAPVLIWVNGLEGCEFVNRAYLEFLDVSGDVDVRRYNWAQFVHPDDRERYVGAYLDCFARRVPFEAQCRFLHHDGKYRWMKASGLPRFSSTGEFLGYVGSSLDVTDIKEAEEKIRELNAELEARVRERTVQLEASNEDLQKEMAKRAHAEEALRTSEAYSRALIENAPDIISVVNADATIRYESPSIERVLGYKPEDRIGKNPFNYIHPDDMPRLLELFNEFITKPGAMRSAEYRIRHQDGSWRFFESFAKALRDETGATMIVANSRDLTERKQAEEQIQFLYFATQAINQAAGFHEALAIALREICTLSGWDYGEAWVPSADGTRLLCSPAWYGDSYHMSSFRMRSEELSFKANEG
ncbi:MAG: PAS domain S-box protein, partial [bacterium]